MRTTEENNPRSYLPCPFCGSQPVRRVFSDILAVECPQCVSIGFHNHIRFGCQADAEWNQRHGVKVMEENQHRGMSAHLFLSEALGGNMNISTLKPLVIEEIMEAYARHRIKFLKQSELRELKADEFRLHS
jgi:hypothetical protein